MEDVAVKWIWIWLTACMFQALCIAAFGAEQAAPPNVSPSVEQQLKELREGQQRILQELEAIKARLQEGPTRTEFGAKPMLTNVISLNVRGELFRGNNDAHIAILEYSDFACSFCARYAREIYPRLQEEYVKSGKVRYYFRDLPAPEHT